MQKGFKQVSINLNPINFYNTKNQLSLKNTETEVTSVPMESNTIPVYEKTPDSKNLFEIFKASRLVQFPVGYREIETFDAPYVGKGKIYQLDNGHNVVIIPKPGPTVVKTFVQVGSSNEPDNINGISHLIEHCMYNGSSKYKKGDFDEIIGNVGAFANAGTSRADTEYYIEYPLQNKDDFERIIALHANTLQYPNFSQDMIDKEKDIILSEKNYRDNPENFQANLLIKLLFNLNIDREGLIGTDQSIKDITRDDMLNYYNTWYTPDNMTTVVTGDVNPTDTIKLFSKYFNKKVKDNANPDKYYLSLNDTIKSTEKYDSRLSRNGKVNLYMAFIGPKNNDLKDRISTMALMQIFADDNFSDIKKEIEPYSTNIAMDIMNVSSYVHDPRVMFLTADFEPGEEEAGLKSVYSTINKLSQEPISDKELKTLKTKLKIAYAKICEDSSGISDIVGSSLINCGDLKGYTGIIDQIDALTPDDIKTATQKYMDLNKTAIIMAHPQRQYDQLLAAQRAKNGLSFGGTTSKVNTDRIKEYNLSNNIRLVLDTTPGTAVGTVNFELCNDIVKSKPGTAEILEEMLNQNQKKYLLNQYNEMANINDVSPDIKIFESNIYSYTFCEPEKVPVLLNRIKDSFYKPVLSQESFDKSRQMVKSKLSKKPYTMEDTIAEEFYGDHPYGYTSRKILENIDNVTIQDVTNLYQTLLSNAHCNVIISMPKEDLNKSQEQIVNSLEQGLPVYQKYKYVNNYDFQPLTENKIIVEPTRNNDATIIQAFKIKESGNVKDEVAVSLISMIMGGSHKSRLFQDLREDQQLAYMVNSVHYSNEHAGELVFKVNTTTDDPVNEVSTIKNNNIKKVLEGFKKHINSLINEPVTEKELKNAKLALKREILNNFETSTDRSLSLSATLDSPYGINYTNELLKAIDSITPEDIQKAAVLFLDKPSIVLINANKDAIERNKDYLSTFESISKADSTDK